MGYKSGRLLANVHSSAKRLHAAGYMSDSELYAITQGATMTAITTIKAHGTSWSAPGCTRNVRREPETVTRALLDIGTELDEMNILERPRWAYMSYDAAVEMRKAHPALPDIPQKGWWTVFDRFDLFIAGKE
jgi:hypothetical protein